MIREQYRQSNKELHRKLDTFHLHSLLIQDSLPIPDYFKKKIPGNQRVFFKALAIPDNFRLLPKDMNTDKLIAKGHGNRYRLYSSFLYTMLHSEKGRQFLSGEHPSLYRPDFNTWRSTINNLLSDDEFSHSFKQNIELNQQMIDPEAVHSIRIIVNSLNPEGKSLTIFDFGCGPNFDIPAMQTDKTAITDKFQTPDELKKYNKRVSISEGIGVDSNPADLDWTRICTIQHIDNIKMIKWKSAVIDELVRIKASAQNVHILRQSILNFTPEKQGDVVITKWMRYQIDDQNVVKEAVLRTLNEDGYWISVGEEEKLKARSEGKKYDFDSDEIWVWQKKNGRLIPVCSVPNKPRPLMKISGKVIDNGKIEDFDRDFFVKKGD